MGSDAAAGRLADIDWDRPWLAPWRAALPPGVSSPDQAPDGIASLLNAAAGCPVRFVPQHDLPTGTAYEQFISDTATVPTRDNLHDFFNGLCWITFPRTKKKLNELQAAEIANAGVRPLRGPVRDALTVFDENAAFLSAPPALWQALQARDWPRLFIDLRPLWQEARLVLFGHALLEKLVAPRKAITAHVYLANPPSESLPDLDAWIAGDLSAERLATKPFCPLPVLGVPLWWADNENFSFYDDSLVFRPRALPITTTTSSDAPKPPPDPTHLAT
ncbi:MAG: DUF3025 domain-containing protein [Haliea sp.]|nr:MAG: DUF3025 domain-containing protein [Haliea sp.]